MRSHLTLLMVFALTTAPGAPADGPRPEAPASAAKEANGKITEPILSALPGGEVKPGTSVSISFKYETTTPGEVSVVVDAMIAGKVNESIRSSAFPLKLKAGNGVVVLRLRGFEDQLVDEFRLVLVPKSEGLKERVAATVKASVRFLTDPNALAKSPKFLFAQIDPAARDRVLLRAHSSQAALDNKKIKPTGTPEPDIKISLKEVRAFGSDGTPIDPKQLPEFLEKPRSVVAVPNNASPAFLQVLNFNMPLLVVPAGTFDAMAAKEAKNWK